MGSYLSKSTKGNDSQEESSGGDGNSPPPFNPLDWPWIWAIRDPEVLDWKRHLSFEEIQACALQQQQLPVRITEHLYLGNAACVQDIAKLQKLGISAVLNVAGPLASRKATIQAYREHQITYKRITAQDENDYPMLPKHWNEAEQFIRNHIRQEQNDNGTTSTSGDINNPKIVVHCVAGMNRSAVIAAAFYMLETQTTVLEAVHHVRKQRGNVALQNEGFQEQLVELSRKHNLLGPQPGTKGAFVADTPMEYNADNDWRATQAKQQNPLDRLSVGG